VCCSLEHHVFCVVKTDAKVATADHSFHTNYIKLCTLRFVMDVVAKHVASCVYIFISGLTNRDYLSFQFCFRSPLQQQQIRGVQHAFLLKHTSKHY